ncbi:MerR family DNA-binding transcriptional regulator [Paenibacillus polymyxa]|uniref:MerR family transcriptional regulator n=1 Tax=Paenibacillus TaxID=44249 RepID=UPI0008FC2816|nr:MULTISPECIES: MerR family transcriptional regulator [Paenibacillus]APB71153.1 MerR family DNA-binding transcriptional regulator [Paenibacillus polymyxa]OMF45787.1 MerR family transcriptional regulator [Paenibacillus peoriae]
MKDYYKISEISKLYGIGIDSLRYYEKLGVLKPQRDVNSYRIYGLNDMYKLNIIRDLRLLDFSMQQIKEYLDYQSIDNTLELLHEEQMLIQKQLKELQTKEQMIHDRIVVLSAASQIKTDVFKIKKMSERPCLKLKMRITRDEEMDFAIKKLHSKHEKKIHDFGNQLYAASVSVDELKDGAPVVFNSVFFILDQDENDFTLPAGEYLSLYYRGGYHQSTDRIIEVITYAKENNLKILGSPFEIYEVDNRDTILEEEYLTEIQVRVGNQTVTD